MGRHNEAMSEVMETEIPGVGIRYEFKAENGQLVSVISFRSGRREVCLANPDDPDTFTPVLALTPNDSQILAELLGGSTVVRHLADLQHRIEGLAIDWLPVRSDSPYAGRTIADTRMRTRSGVSIVAVVRGQDAFPAPGPGFRLAGGDYLVVVGTPGGIEDTVHILRDG